MTRRTLTLTEVQRQELLQLRDHDPRPYVRERGAALLKIADGQSPHRVACQGLLKPRDPDIVVTVGNALAGVPPCRTVRAELPHTAPTSGAWRRSVRSDTAAGPEPGGTRSRRSA